ncbi:Tropinone reductase-like 1 [Morella rubra]|uniref:Tropinone reductase-like 1 n=1 Tax=Morella rubra TaxID=262757 RepID=A0A6A1VHJ1_9ROSI|nr:Tropinone reductase-like 1 [Morella rubra]
MNPASSAASHKRGQSRNHYRWCKRYRSKYGAPLHEHGAKVVIADIQDNLGQTLADKLGENVSYIHCDVSNEEDICNLIDTTIAKYGTLDIMYNNAGICDSPFGRILETKKSDLERMLNVNLVGAFLGAKHAARVMVPQRKGCILFTTSAATSIAGLSSHAYAASKCGVQGLVRNLTAELGQHGIRVNCVSPYAVVTGMPIFDFETAHVDPAQMEMALSGIGNLQGQILKAEGVAKAALYLASDEANYVSGLNLLVDGGYSVVNPSMTKFVESLGKLQK